MGPIPLHRRHRAPRALHRIPALLQDRRHQDQLRFDRPSVDSESAVNASGTQSIERNGESFPVRQLIDQKPYSLAILSTILDSRQVPPPQSQIEAVTTLEKRIAIKKKAVYTPDPHLSNPLKAIHRNDVVVGFFKLCVRTDGTIESVQPTLPIIGASRDISKVLALWRFEPMDVCCASGQFGLFSGPEIVMAGLG